MVFFHRFYSRHDFNDHNRFEVAVACILLAAKTEECPRKLSHVIQECNRLKNPTAAVMDPKSDEYLQLKERVLLLERVVLHTISFELSIIHPDRFVIERVKNLYKNGQIEYNPDSEQDFSNLSQNLMQRAINFVNDSMCTNLCVTFDAKDIAHACIYLGALSTDIRPKNNKSWLDIFDISIEVLVEICECIMELVNESKRSVSGFQEIKRSLQDLKLLKKKADNT